MSPLDILSPNYYLISVSVVSLVARNRKTRVYTFPSDFGRWKLRISRRKKTNTGNWPFFLHLTTFQGFKKALYIWYVLGVSNINRSVPNALVICVSLHRGYYTVARRYEFYFRITEITSPINSRVRLWKINHSGPGCSFYEFYECYIF